MGDNSAIKPFYSNLLRLVQDLVTMFPSCPKTADKLAKFQSNETNLELQKRVIEIWDSKMMPYYEACKDMDETTINSLTVALPFFKDIDFVSKWQHFREEDKDIFWDYMRCLNMYARLYSLFHSGFTDFLRSKADSLKPFLEKKDQDGLKNHVKLILDEIPIEEHVQLRKNMAEMYISQGGMRSVEDCLK